MAPSDSEAALSGEAASEDDNHLALKISSNYFQGIVMCVIVLNTLCTAIQTDHPRWFLPSGCTPPPDLVIENIIGQFGPCYEIWYYVNTSFLFFFVVELSLRLYAFGCRGFFCSKDECAWNWFDFFVVVVAGLDYVKFCFHSHTANAKVLTTLRALRIMRLLRVVRLLKFDAFKKLRLLLQGLLTSFEVVSWIMLFLFVMIFACAIFCTDLLGHQAALWGHEAGQIKERWGSMYKSMITLFQVLTLDDWNTITLQVYEVMPYMVIFFNLFVFFGSFVVLSLLTGAMADHMEQVRESNEEEDKKDNTEDFAVEIKTLQATLVPNGTAEFELTRPEFRKLFEDPACREKLESSLNSCDLKAIDGDEADTLFDCFDADNNGGVSWDEFRAGMNDIRKGLQPKHILELHSVACRALDEVERNKGTLRPIAKAPNKRCEEELERAEAMMDTMESRVQVFETRIKDVMEKVAKKRSSPWSQS